MVLPLVAEPVRVATYNVELYRKGPGLMLRDILRGDPQANAVARVIAHAAPDILVLQGVDYDAELHGARALRDLIAKVGPHYPHVFALRPNTGIATGIDLNGDGRISSAQDTQGFGYFAGQKGMVIFSLWPINDSQVQDFSNLLWRDFPDASLPVENGAPFPSEQAQAVQRLSTTGHWIVPVSLPDGSTLTLMTFAATTPVFDGPEDRNGLRNADEIRLWERVLARELGTPPDGRFFILGKANLDPDKGQGRRGAIRSLLGHPRVQDVLPVSPTGGLNTTNWEDPLPGKMRVDYVLPSRDWQVEAAGVVWPDAATSPSLYEDADLASGHRLVWVDVAVEGMSRE